MSIGELRKCDGKKCDKTSDDYMRDGWIIIEGKFAKYKGRNEINCAVTEIYVGDKGDFCSFKCLKSRTGYAK